jgi:hypothetical protein
VLPELIAAIGPQPLQIDASSATQIGQAMLQLLVSARRTGAGAVIEPSAVLIEVARLTALTDVLFEPGLVNGNGA